MVALTRLGPWTPTLARWAPKPARALACLGLLVAPACSSDTPSTGSALGTARLPAVGGCECASGSACADLSYSDVPVDGIYVATTFGGGSETGPMSCGGTADATWAYASGRARFGCGAKLLVEAGGQRCVVLVADCGPNRCVEEAICGCACAQHRPSLGLSPLVTTALLGAAQVGWSEGREVAAGLVDPGSTVGCPGTVVGGAGGAGGASGGAAGAGGGAAGSTSSGGSAGTGALGGAGGGGAAGSGGTAGGSGAPPCSAPDCSACLGCSDHCLCELGDPTGCADICAGGAAGAQSGGAAGATCALPTCSVCPDCFTRCMCVAGDEIVCSGVCGAGDGGAGAVAGGAGAPGGGAGAPPAGAAGASGAGQGSPPSEAAPLAPVSRCECAHPGARPAPRSRGVVWPSLLAAVWLAAARRARRLRARAAPA